MSRSQANQRECWFGWQCDRYQCYFRHPNGRRRSDCVAGSHCNNLRCRDLHPRDPRDHRPTNTRNARSCRYGQACIRYDCWFSHPLGRFREPCPSGMQCLTPGCCNLHPRGYVAVEPRPRPMYPEPRLPVFPAMSLWHDEEDLDVELERYHLFITVLRALSLSLEDDDIPVASPDPVTITTREQAALALRDKGCTPFVPEGLKTCVVCLDNPFDCCLVKCGHVCVCMSCVKQLQSPSCPLCRQGITHVIPLEFLDIGSKTTNTEVEVSKPKQNPVLIARPVV